VTDRSPAEHPVSLARHLRAIALLPFMNTVVIPSLILLFSRDFAWPVIQGLGVATTLAAIIAGTVGLGLVISSIGLFVRSGRGTLAPWDPTRTLVVQGPYRHLRNPMKLGLFLILLAEALLLRSVALSAWLLIFASLNMIYIRVSEEPGLKRRFGRAYVRYCKQVPAWLPRLHPWAPASVEAHS
jgi:protein-S-isoprenylcysteine O-methyltransferase Ste14